MKEKLLERLRLIDNTIVEHNAKVQQAMADLNALQGARQELAHIISVIDQPEPLEPVNDLTLDKLHDECENDKCEEDKCANG